MIVRTLGGAQAVATCIPTLGLGTLSVYLKQDSHRAQSIQHGECLGSCGRYLSCQLRDLTEGHKVHGVQLAGEVGAISVPGFHSNFS